MILDPYINARGRRPGVVRVQYAGDVTFAELSTGLVHTEVLELRQRARADGVSTVGRRSSGRWVRGSCWWLRWRLRGRGVRRRTW